MFVDWVACVVAEPELVGSALLSWLLCVVELLCIVELVCAAGLLSAAELVCAAGLLCATELLCAITMLGAAELLSSDVEAGIVVVSAIVFVPPYSLVTAAAVSKAVLMPSFTVVVAATSTVESSVAYGSVSQEV